MRVLGVDFGRKRIGLAVGEVSAGLANARPTLAASGTLTRDAEQLVAWAQREEVDGLVLGLPMDAEGRPTSLAPIIEKLGSLLQSRGVRVWLVNEALTSAESEALMRQHGLTAAERRYRVDGESACRILERFFAEWPSIAVES